MLCELPAEALRYGVFWVSRLSPQVYCETGSNSRRAFWVQQFDFDELMLQVRRCF